MATRHILSPEEKMSLIKERDRGLSYRELSDKFQLSIGAVSNIFKRKWEYVNDYQTNQNKKVKDDLSQRLSDAVYEWFMAERSKNIPISGPVLREYARKVATASEDFSDKFDYFKLVFEVPGGDFGTTNRK